MSETSFKIFGYLARGIAIISILVYLFFFIVITLRQPPPLQLDPWCDPQKLDDCLEAIGGHSVYFWYLLASIFLALSFKFPRKGGFVLLISSIIFYIAIFTILILLGANNTSRFLEVLLVFLPVPISGLFFLLSQNKKTA